jgi:WD40 repeat protein
VIEGYHILGELGRGGMGVVYKARQVGLNRLVALKMILAGPHAGPRDLARFRQEAEAAARLHHPNIVQVHAVGEAAGQPFFVLEYVEGGSLAHRLRGDPQPVRVAARLVETLARAVHYAHQNHVVHRDLKPANILLASLSREPGVCATAVSAVGAATADIAVAQTVRSRLNNLVPKVTDFGLAKRLDEPGNGTHSAEVLGTPSYMAPEQAHGKGLAVGPATDVYALGAILYELLTGRPPFKAETPVDTVVQVLHEEPVRPGRLRPGLPRDLETVCLRCLEKEPRKRYPSALALAEDLHRFLQGDPVLARPVSPAERAWKWARRRPLTAALLAGMIFVAVLGFAGVTWQWREAAAARDAALTEKREKEDQRRQARQALYYSRIAQSQLQWRVNDFTGAEQSLARCLPEPGHLDRRGWEWHYLHGLCHTALLTLEHGHGGAGGGIAVRPDGRQIASVVGGPGDDGGPGELCLWETTGGEPVARFEVPGSLNQLAFDPEGTRLALAGTDGTVLVREVTGGERWHARRHTDAVTGLAFSPDGRRLASAGWDGAVRLLDARTGEVLHTLRGGGARLEGVAFHPDGRTVAAGSWDSTVCLWDVATGEAAGRLEGHKSAVYSVAFSPDGRHLASAGNNGNLRIWDLARRRVIQSLTGHAGVVLDLAYSPDGRYLAHSGGDATVRVWDVDSGVESIIFRGHRGPVEAVRFSPDGRRLLSCCPGQGVVKVWDLTRHPEYATFARTVKDIEALAFRDEGRKLVSVTLGGKLQTWDVVTGVLEDERLLALADEVISPAVVAAFSADGRHLAARSRQDPRLVKVWDVATGKETRTFGGHGLPVRCVRISPDGRHLASAACDATGEGRHEVKVWDVATGKQVSHQEGVRQVFNLAFSADGRWLARGEQGGAVVVAEWGTGRVVLQVRGHEGDVAGLAFSPDGRQLVSAGSTDRTVKVWGLAGGAPGEPLHNLPAPNFLGDLAFSPDGRRLAGISRDLVKLWDAETGHEVLTLRGAPQRYYDPAFNPRVLFSPDGRCLVGTNWDESISLWEAGVRTEAEKAARQQARALFWHLQEAEHCLEPRDHKNQAAALFHLGRLGADPLPAPLQARKDRLVRLLAP